MPTTTPSAPGAAVAAGDRADKVAKRASGLRANSIAISVMLLAQYGLGMWVNLYEKAPSGPQAMSHLPGVALAHAVFGVFLLIAGISVLVRSILVRRPVLMATSAAGLAAIFAAAGAGMAFVSTGSGASSMAMAAATAVAMLCYLVNLAAARR